MIKIFFTPILFVIGFSLFSQKLPSHFPSNSPVHLTFRMVDSSSYEPVYADQAKRDSLKKKYGRGNRHREAKAVQNYLLEKKQYSFLERQSDNEGRWNVRLENGGNLATPESPHISGYTFEKFYDDSGFIVFREQWGEGNGYLLINRKNGEKTSLWGAPIFNPSGDFFIAINADLMAGYSANGLQLFEVINGKPVLVIQYNMKIAPSRAQWINEDSFQLETYFWSGEYMQKYFEHYFVQIVFSD